ncbi:hypothetical protein PM082_007138 [Marasmius tenuissimus]|nr:hypothetical protein PM082_007138 [Marasmius tenuissimus]
MSSKSTPSIPRTQCNRRHDGRVEENLKSATTTNVRLVVKPPVVLQLDEQELDPEGEKASTQNAQ